MTKRAFIRILYLVACVCFSGLMFAGCFGEKGPEGDKTEVGLHSAPGSLVSETVLNQRLLRRLPIVDRSGSILVVSRENPDGSITRYYPNGDMARSVMGYLDEYGRGLDGVEYSYDSVLLAGSDQRTRKHLQAFALTIDRKIQALAAENLRWQMRRLKAVRGSQIIMDLETGHIIAMSNYSHYYRKTKKGPVRENYALEDGVNPWGLAINLSLLNFRQAECQRAAHLSPGADQVRNRKRASKKMGRSSWHWQTFGHKGKLWTRLTSDDLDELSVDSTTLRQLIRLGMGQPTGIDLPGESQGSLPVSFSDNVTSIIDSGMDASPIQILCAFSSIIHGGSPIRPAVGAYVVKDLSGRKEGFFDQDALLAFLRDIGDDHGPSIASVTKRAYGDKSGFQIIGMGIWPAKSPKISYITLLDNAKIDASRRRGTLGRTALVAKAAAFLPRSAGLPPRLKGNGSKGFARDSMPSVIPDLRGRSLRNALETVGGLGLSLQVKGAGTVRRQYPRPGSRIKKGGKCVIICKD